jgi:hypothetical protein
LTGGGAEVIGGAVLIPLHTGQTVILVDTGAAGFLTQATHQTGFNGFRVEVGGGTLGDAGGEVEDESGWTGCACGWLVYTGETVGGTGGAL